MIPSIIITSDLPLSEMPSNDKDMEAVAPRRYSTCAPHSIPLNEAQLFEYFFKTLQHPAFIIDLNVSRSEAQATIVNAAAGNFLLTCATNFYNNSHLEAFKGSVQDMINVARRKLAQQFTFSDILHIEMSINETTEDCIYNLSATSFETTEDSRKLAIVLMEVPKPMKEEIRALDCFKASLMSALSHELNTPMNSLMPILKMMPSYISDDRNEDLKEVALSSAVFLQTKIRDLIDYTKISLKDFNPQLSEFYVNDLFDDIVKIFKYEIHQKSNTLITKIETIHSAKLLIYADKNRVEQVLMKLVSNANKFTQNGTIHLIASENKQNFNVTFSVKDTGLGISRNHLQNLFAPLPEKSKLTTNFAKLPGLGLDIAKSICENMDSQLVVTSIKGKGSTFTFEIPTCRIIDFSMNATRSRQSLKELPIATPRFTPKINKINDIKILIEAINNERTTGDQTHKDSKPLYSPQSGSAKFNAVQNRKRKSKIHNRLMTIDDLSKMSLDVDPESEICDEHSAVTQSLSQYQTIISAHCSVKRDKLITAPSGMYATIELTPKQQVVLIVDDLFSNRMVIHEMLKRYKIITQEAINGQDAVQIVENSFKKDSTFEIVLILMDLNMPVMGGIEAAQKIRILEKAIQKISIPIVAVTAHDGVSDKKACFETGMQDFVIKPIDFKRLRKIIKDFVPKMIEDL